jgi:hypothetical protein
MEAKMRSSIRFFAGSSLAVLLAACGGGGGGGNSGGTVNNGGGGGPVPPRAQITAQNRDQVAGVAWAAGNANAAGGVVTGTANIRTLGSPQLAAPSAETNFRRPCGTGSLDLTINDADDSLGISNGDVLTMKFSSCFSPGESTLSGQMAMRFSNVVGNPFNPSAYNADVTFTGFTDVDAVTGETSTLAGTSAFQVAQQGGQITLVMNSGDLAVTEGAESARITNPNLTFVFNPDDSGTQYGTSVISSSKLGGSFEVSIAQNQAIVFGANGDPTSGVLVVTGNNSKMTITVLDDQQARIDLDANNDGETEESKVVTLDELDALI